MLVCVYIYIYREREWEREAWAYGDDAHAQMLRMLCVRGAHANCGASASWLKITPPSAHILLVILPRAPIILKCSHGFCSQIAFTPYSHLNQNLILSKGLPPKYSHAEPGQLYVSVPCLCSTWRCMFPSRIYAQPDIVCSVPREQAAYRHTPLNLEREDINSVIYEYADRERENNTNNN